MSTYDSVRIIVAVVSITAYLVLIAATLRFMAFLWKEMKEIDRA